MMTSKLLDEFRNYLMLKHVSEKTVMIYSIAIKKLFEYLEKNPKKLTKKDIDDYILLMKSKYEHNTLIPKMTAIKHFMKFLGKEIDLKLPHYIQKNTDVLTEEEIGQIFKASEYHPRNNAILKTLYYTAIRKSELININIDDIDFNNELLKINNGKRNSYRTVFIHPECMKAIKRYLELRKPPKNKNKNGLFISQKGGRLKACGINSIVKNIGVMAGIEKKIYPHIFRSSIITHLHKNNASLREIQSISGHKRIETLMIYIRPDEKELRKAYIDKTPIFNDEPKKLSKSKEDQLKIQQNLIPDNKSQNIEEKIINLYRDEKISKEDFMTLMTGKPYMKDDLIGYV